MPLQTWPNLRQLVDPLLGQPYDAYDCWDLLRTLLQQGWNLDLREPGMVATQFMEIWFRDDPRPVLSLVQPWDCLILSCRSVVGDHCAIVLDDTSLVHAQRKAGVAIEPLRRWQRMILQVARLRQMV